MKEYSKSEVIDRLFNERNENFENFVTEVVSETEKELFADIETKLKEKFNNPDELVNLLDNISLLCNLNSKAYYKIGMVDGIKLNQELQVIFGKGK